MNNNQAARLIAPLAWWAIAWAVLLAVGEIARNWGDWQWWPFWLADMLASAFLIIGAWFALRKGGHERLSPLVAAFGFCTAGAYDSFFFHLEIMNQPVSGNIAHGPLTAIIGVLFGVALLTLIFSLVISVRLGR